MKKIIFTIFLLTFFSSTVNAFSIDIDKIEIHAKSNKLIDTLDQSYKIEIDKFKKDIINDRESLILTNRLIDISFGDKNTDIKKKDITNYLYINSENGFDTLNSVIFLDTYLDSIKDNKIKIGTISDIKTGTIGKDTISIVYINNALVDGKKQNIMVNYWLKEDNGIKKLYYPLITYSSDIESHFDDIGIIEETGKIVGKSYKGLSLIDSSVSNSKLKELYNKVNKNVVQITSNTEAGFDYGSGFFLREGVVVTTWSLFNKYLNDGTYIFVNDVDGNTYNILGIIAADVDLDVVVLKINDETGEKVSLGNSNDIKSKDIIFTVNSKYNGGFSINYGNNISYNRGKFKNLFLLSESDVGSALFNSKGQVIGINTEDKINSPLSYANSTDYLKKLQTKLVKQEFKDIKYTNIDRFKDEYYLKIRKEKVYNMIPSTVYDKFKKIGNLDKNITLDLVKASYKDGIVSLRYKNNTNGLVDSIYLASLYTLELTKQGYKETYYSEDKLIYKNDKYKVIIKNNLNYLIVLIMEI